MRPKRHRGVGGRAEAGQAHACTRTRARRVQGHDFPDRIQIYDVVRTSEVVANLPDLIPRRTRGRGLGRVAKPYGSLADTAQAAFHGRNDELVRLEPPLVETGREAPDGRHVVENLLKAPARAF